jgi:cobalamin biosynthesis protein CobD/CbiB
MSFSERLEAGLVAIGVSLVVAAVSATGWVIRRVLTNEQQIKMLQREIEGRDALRAADRAALGEVRTDVREMRAEVRMLCRRDG